MNILLVDGKETAYNEGWTYPHPDDYQEYVSPWLPENWGKWSIITLSKTDGIMKAHLVCGRVR